MPAAPPLDYHRRAGAHGLREGPTLMTIGKVRRRAAEAQAVLEVKKREIEVRTALEALTAALTLATKNIAKKGLS